MVPVVWYREFEPCEALRPYVRSFFSFVPSASRTQAPGRRVTLDIPFGATDSFSSPLFADGNVSLIFNLERTCGTDGVWRSAPAETAVIGPMTVVGAPRDAARAEMVGAYFLPGRASPFLRVPTSHLVDRIVALDDLWGRCATDLTGELSAKREEQRVDALEHALLRRLGRALVRSSSVDTAALASWATAERGRVTVARMAEAAGVSRQTLARAFRETVGVTPKVYCMLARFQAGLAYAGRGAKVDWARVACDLGYADQSHMIMEFRRFSSLTPHEVTSGAWFHPFIERARRASNETAAFEPTERRL
jgi:AraC-like DNA-binding protein